MVQSALGERAGRGGGNWMRPGALGPADVPLPEREPVGR
jgi:hypothetical protein